MATESVNKPTTQLTESDVCLLRKKTKFLLQHHGLKLVDIIPGLVKTINTTRFELLDIPSLIQIGQHILEEDKISDKASEEFLSKLTDIILNSVDVKNSEDADNLSSKYCFLLAVWHKKDSVLLKIGVQKILEEDWKQYLQLILLDMTVQYHNDGCLNNSLFHIPSTICFLKLCRHSPLILQQVLSTLCYFVIHTKGCRLLVQFVEEFMKKVHYISQEEFVLLFPPMYRNLVYHLQTSPDKVNERHVMMELLIMVFNEDRHKGFTLMLCFPLWLPHLAHYYEETYNKNLFIDFQF